ncbi:MAG: hypothetical protein LUC44_08775, partial [Prevotellaceae bacterium]|nr:hypothetical protein [Prevotellaceae bacterium]
QSLTDLSIMMKRLSMFVAMACLGLALPIYAQDVSWTAPTLSALTLTGQTLESGSSYYLYNVGAGMFYVNGNDYGTEASLGSTGLLVALTATTDGNYTICYDSNKYLYYDYNTAFGAHFWYDGTKISESSNGAYYFEITETSEGSNVYSIKSKATDETNNVTIGYLGYEEGSTEIAINVNLETNAENGQWLLISSDDYDAYQAAVAANVSREFLLNALTDASELGIDTEDAGETYESAEATADEIVSATKTLAEEIQAKGTASGDVVKRTTTDEDGNEETTLYQKVGANLIPNPSFRYGIACYTYETGVPD